MEKTLASIASKPLLGNVKIDFTHDNIKSLTPTCAIMATILIYLSQPQLPNQNMASTPLEHPQREIISVSQLNRRVRRLLETQFPLIWVEGEISNVSFPASGHWYFTLKDSQAQVRCVMFKGRNGRVQFRPESGQHIMIRCRVGLYENRGDFQVIAEHMEDAGHGALQRRFDELKARLAEEGIFSQQYKQPLPFLPSRIGVVTSPTGAAIHDIITVLKRRFPAIPVTIYPCPVQGAEACEQIVAAIDLANRDKRCDVLIVGRGGGSLEDLWPFNEEAVARAIFDSRIPIVSAVGHEVDFTIADFVADSRAATPSVAAEMICPDANELAASFAASQLQLSQNMVRVLRQRQQQVDHLSQRLRHPGERIQQQQQRLTHTLAHLMQAAEIQLQHRHSLLNTLISRFNRFHPQQQVQQLQVRNQSLQQRLRNSIKHLLLQKQTEWENTVHMLNTLSPLQTLERGYAIVRNRDSQVVKTITNVEPGEQITALISDGTLLCHIDEIASDTGNEKA